MLCITLAFTASMPAVSSFATALSGQTAPLAHRTVHVVFGNHLDIGMMVYALIMVPQCRASQLPWADLLCMRAATRQPEMSSYVAAHGTAPRL